MLKDRGDYQNREEKTNMQTAFFCGCIVLFFALLLNVIVLISGIFF